MLSSSNTKRLHNLGDTCSRSVDVRNGILATPKDSADIAPLPTMPTLDEHEMNAKMPSMEEVGPTSD